METDLLDFFSFLLFLKWNLPLEIDPFKLQKCVVFLTVKRQEYTFSKLIIDAIVTMATADEQEGLCHGQSDFLSS